MLEAIRLKGLVQRPKRVFVDAALAAAALRADEATVMNDGQLLDPFSRRSSFHKSRPRPPRLAPVPASFTFGPSSAVTRSTWWPSFPGDGSSASRSGAAAAPGPPDARHLVWLRDEIGDAFVGGVVLHTGTRSYGLSDRMAAAPIASLWPA